MFLTPDFFFQSRVPHCIDVSNEKMLPKQKRILGRFIFKNNPLHLRRRNKKTKVNTIRKIWFI
jgi:hypothetical protein